MPPPDNFRICRVTWVYQKDSRRFNNTLHLYKSTGWTPTDLVSAASAAHTWFTTFLKPTLSNLVGLANIHLQVYDPHGNPYVYDSAVSPVEFGTVSTETEPGNVTMSMSLRAGLAGRAYRGRMYHPGLTTTATNIDDTIQSGFLTAAATALSGLLTAFPAGMVPVIFHRNDNLFSTIVAWVVENILDSQRRRLPGRGA